MAFYTLFDVGLAGYKIPVAFLSGVYTVPEKRGRGYMKKTVTALENAARKNGEELILETPPYSTSTVLSGINMSPSRIKINMR